MSPAVARGASTKRTAKRRATNAFLNDPTMRTTLAKLAEKHREEDDRSAAPEQASQLEEVCFFSGGGGLFFFLFHI